MHRSPGRKLVQRFYPKLENFLLFLLCTGTKFAYFQISENFPLFKNNLIAE